ncbi:MAG: helix-turn-helix domain-containing protein [Henriciella sp.]|nr:helix-turn-helix domain-containing protein [Henriciella sp.]
MIPTVSRSPVPPSACNLAKAIELIGDRWTLLILRSALFGVRRFDAFQAELEIPRTVLSGRLKALVEAGVLEKTSYKMPGKRPRAEYVLTEMGESLRPILIGLTQWGDRWVSKDGAAPIGFTDGVTREPVRAGLVNAQGREVPANRMRIKLRR